MTVFFKIFITTGDKSCCNRIEINDASKEETTKENFQRRHCNRLLFF